MLHAAYLDGHGQKLQARADLESAMAEKDILRDFYPPELSLRLKAAYASVLDETGEHDQARTLFQELCAGTQTPDFHTLLVQANAC